MCAGARAGALEVLDEVYSQDTEDDEAGPSQPAHRQRAGQQQADSRATPGAPAAAMDTDGPAAGERPEQPTGGGAGGAAGDAATQPLPDEALRLVQSRFGQLPGSSQQGEVLGVQQGGSAPTAPSETGAVPPRQLAEAAREQPIEVRARRRRR
jgi:hypothetical protein